ncbi:unnamed protein product [Rotaria sp. Silwood1]|nr:unnamed protein product [Rotaria sp. Silwood1]
MINYDFQLYYLKWMLDNLSHVRKVKLRLKINGTGKKDPVINESLVDANFVRKYLISDVITNLTHFDFYIISTCQLSLNNTQRIINSFKIHPFFIQRQWTNVKCFFDSKMYHHLSSSLINISSFFPNLNNYPDIFNWPDVKYVEVGLQPSLYLFFEQFDKLFPNVSCIKFQMGSYDGRTDQNKKRARLLAHLLSMPLQLNYLRIQQFQWLLHVIAYTSDELLKNALKNVRYAEFCLTSCHFGSNQSIGIGKFLVLVLSNYMPHLQALRLWRPGDFPWTTRVLFTVQKALPILVDGGSIIRIGSASSIKGHPTAGVYSESKAAIRSFAQWWTIDLKEQKIHVNTLSPGSVETAMCRSVAHSEVVKTTFVNNLIATVPMDPIDTPDEIAKAVVFLASEDSSYVTGIELLVDGGRGLT